MACYPKTKPADALCQQLKVAQHAASSNYTSGRITKREPLDKKSLTLNNLKRESTGGVIKSDVNYLGRHKISGHT